MKNRVSIEICGETYNFVADESPEYMEKVGQYVSQKMDEMLATAKVGRTDAAVLTAANIADELFKSYESAEKLRAQIKEYADEAGRAQAEVSNLKREVFRLEQLQQKQNAKSGGNRS